jgi:protein gp37
MADQTNIEWADSTFNPWIGCTKISPACDHCYAETLMDSRLGRVQWGAGQQRVRTSPANWRKPVQWNARADAFRECAACGWRGDLARRDEPLAFACPACDVTDWRPARRRVFCASLADVFDNEVDPQWRADLFDLIARCENLDFLLLTKRIGNVRGMLPVTWTIGATKPWPNVWLGATICNQEEADRDIPKLLSTPAALRFVSIEPMLSQIDLNLGWNNDTGRWDSSGRELPLRRIDWVICGGESGPGARPMQPEWVRSLRDQCETARVPFMFKQWGEWAPEATSAHGDAPMVKYGKHLAGRRIDGRTHDGFPGTERSFRASEREAGTARA